MTPLAHGIYRCRRNSFTACVQAPRSIVEVLRHLAEVHGVDCCETIRYSAFGADAVKSSGPGPLIRRNCDSRVTLTDDADCVPANGNSDYDVGRDSLRPPTKYRFNATGDGAAATSSGVNERGLVWHCSVTPS
jgi:hypothetical protein